MNDKELLSTGSIARATGLERQSVVYWLKRKNIEHVDIVKLGSKTMKLYDQSVVNTIQNARREAGRL